MNYRRKSELTMLAAFLVICLLVEILAGLLTDQGVHTWYPTIKKPSWTPPNYLFGPVWTFLYISMAVALWLVWKTSSAYKKSSAYIAFGVQLFLNLIWSGLFFSLKSPVLGLIDITLLWLAILITLLLFYKINRMAAYLLIPYLLWVTYAWALNFTIWKMN